VGVLRYGRIQIGLNLRNEIHGLRFNHTSAVDCYIYLPLPASNVRLLHLYPGSGDDRITISFLSYPADNITEEYQALSYTWGKPCSGHKVYCGEKVLLVTCNLWLALRRLRHETQVRTLWIDALCIDQKNISERNCQVWMMRDVYQKAREVIVWLGEETSHTGSAFALLQRLASALETATSSASPAPRLTGWKEFLRAHNLPGLDSPSWKALDALFWRPWYYRMWIVQEVALAKSILVRCGQHSTTWQDLDLVAAFIMGNAKPDSTLANRETEINITANPLVRLSRIIKAFHLSNKTLSLEELLMLTINSISSLPVDKIYGVLGMASDSIAGSITPQYNIPAHTVFRSLAQTFLQHSLDILSQIAAPSWWRISKLPSWVPDWSQAFIAAPLLQQAGQPKSVVAASCGATRASMHFSSDGTKMYVTGLLFDTIASVGQLFYSRGRGSRRTESRVRDRKLLFLRTFWQWERLASRLQAYPTGEDVRDVYCRTLVANLDVANAGEASHRDVYSCVRHSFLDIPLDGWSDAVRLAQVEFMNVVDRVALGRRFFTTSRGYMGLGPLSASAGDEVVLFCGGKTPYVVHTLKRGGKKEFRFEGEAYVHGIMNGEAFQSNPQSSEFVLV
jgi:hypothetical protein